MNFGVGLRSQFQSEISHWRLSTKFMINRLASKKWDLRHITIASCLHIQLKRVIVKEADSMREILTSEGFKARKSPTKLHISKVSLPQHFLEYAKRILQHENIKHLDEEAEKLFAHLRFRQPPIEEDEYRQKVTQVEGKVKEQDNFIEPFLGKEQKESLEKSQHNRIKTQLKRSIYHWNPISFDHSKALQYMIVRTPAEYAALSRVFHEIVHRDPHFKPMTLFDFGSGIGSVVWAAQLVWSSSLIEHMCVDASREMNDIAEVLIKKGSAKHAPIFPGIYFRQFLPVGTDAEYDLTVSSYSLLELPSAASRMEILDKLWKKTKKYLVLLESGSNAGFQVVNEARDFILGTHIHKVDDGDEMRSRQGHAFAPCPHDFVCPRYINDTTPCNFPVRYRPLLPFGNDITKTEYFSFVILRKGRRLESDEQWPRLVRDPLLRGKHVICRLCTKNGSLEEGVLTKGKHLRPLYACARRSHCGDLLPIEPVQCPDPTGSEENEVRMDKEFVDGVKVRYIGES